MRIVALFSIILLSLQASAQQKTSDFTKFGKITVENLQQKVYPIDSFPHVVVLSDVGEAAIEGNSKNWFSINFKRHRVVHILNKSGYDEADVEVFLYASGDAEEKLDNVKAVTYNLENGRIVETKLDKSSIFREKIDKNRVIRKFTMPNVKEGCIIEYEYTVTSDYIQNLDPWFFQGGSPVLWSEFTLTVPEFFSYAFLSHGYHPIYINDRKNRQENFTVMETRTTGASERSSFTAGVTEFRWVMKDVPELKTESFTSTIKNHISRIEFQLASQGYPLPPHNYRSSWDALVRGLNESESFGHSLKNSNNWLSEDIRPVMAGAENEMEKARRIFEFVRDNFTCTDHHGIWTDQNLKNVLKTKKGSVSEINLLLTAMMRYAGIKANPVILSTTEHGYATETYPLITAFNYVVARVECSGEEYYLDASHSRLGFGKMLPNCYNGHARVVDDLATPVRLSPDSIREKKLTAVFISNNDKGEWMGSMSQTAGYFESYMIREKIKEKSRESFFKEIEKDLGNDVRISDSQIDSLNKLEDPVTLRFSIEFKPAEEDLFYFDPMFGEGFEKNPFTATERYYPVEMPYTMDETYLLTMEIPKGYEVDELPKQLVAKLDEEQSAYFEYRISISGTTISLRSRITMSRTNYHPDEYESLRAFFNMVVNKQNEQIVFKKKK